jgi:glucose-6-phosphate-specific signal transduction histidine kinase
MSSVSVGPVPVWVVDDQASFRQAAVEVLAKSNNCCTEALQNAAKHGGPDARATISGRADGNALTLVIRDSGRGFDPATIGTGLTNMTDRLAAIGGQLTIDTAPGHGTCIIATVTASLLSGAPDEMPRTA